jgi:tRNA threonylcarbamoyladenosine biosynthesis protein TsaB
MPLPEAIARIAAARHATLALTGPLPRPAPLYLRAADAAPPADPAPVILP